MTDLATGLTWQRERNNVGIHWPLAVSYCQGLGLAGGGWRLPTVKELRSIVDDRMSYPAIDNIVFPGLVATYFWSATTDAENNANAWSVLFDTGYAYSHYSKTGHSFYVRCVR